jgi:IclR family pca regulon transcriptional regulator
MSVHLTVGTRLPAAGTSAGTVLLAGRAEVSERTEGAGLAEGDRRTKVEGTITARSEAGYALMDEELEEGLRTIAVPIRDRNGRTVAALTAATHAARRTLEECVQDILPALTTTASHIETDLQVASRFTHVPLT